MIVNQPDHLEQLTAALKELCNKIPIRFRDVLPNDLPERPGIYLITKVEDEFEIPYWIGRADNIKHRVFTGLLMGGYASTSFKKELEDKKICANVEDAKKFIRDHCTLRWLRIQDARFRDTMVCFAAAMLNPKCGMPREP